MQVGGEVLVWSSREGFPFPGSPMFVHLPLDPWALPTFRSTLLGSPEFVAGSIPIYALILGYVLVWAVLVVWRKRKYDSLPRPVEEA